MNIITISGKARAGKDVFAEEAKAHIERLGDSAIIFHYADFLKFICKQYFGWDGVKDNKGRSLLQFVGTNIFRKNNPDCWAEMAKSFVSGLGRIVSYVIIPDTRFPNEISVWEEGDFSVKTVHVTRPGNDNGLTEEQKKHPSETALDGYAYDYEVINEGTIQEYQEKVRETVENILASF